MLNPPLDDFRAALYSCAAVRRWVDEVAAAAPFGSSQDLLAAARSATPFSAAEIDEALGDHPRIGEKHSADTAAADFSRTEQAASETEDEALARALAEGNAEYEQRFGRIFLIRAKGRSRPEIVAELRRRLTLDDETELTTVSNELRDIALLRLESTYAEQLS